MSFWHFDFTQCLEPVERLVQNDDGIMFITIDVLTNLPYNNRMGITERILGNIAAPYEFDLAQMAIVAEMGCPPRTSIRLRPEGPEFTIDYSQERRSPSHYNKPHSRYDSYQYFVLSTTRAKERDRKLIENMLFRASCSTLPYGCNFEQQIARLCQQLGINRLPACVVVFACEDDFPEGEDGFHFGRYGAMGARTLRTSNQIAIFTVCLGERIWPSLNSPDPTVAYWRMETVIRHENTHSATLLALLGNLFNSNEETDALGHLPIDKIIGWPVWEALADILNSRVALAIEETSKVNPNTDHFSLNLLAAHNARKLGGVLPWINELLFGIILRNYFVIKENTTGIISPFFLGKWNPFELERLTGEFIVNDLYGAATNVAEKNGRAQAVKSLFENAGFNVEDCLEYIRALHLSDWEHFLHPVNDGTSYRDKLQKRLVQEISEGAQRYDPFGEDSLQAGYK